MKNMMLSEQFINILCILSDYAKEWGDVYVCINFNESIAKSKLLSKLLFDPCKDNPFEDDIIFEYGEFHRENINSLTINDININKFEIQLILNRHPSDVEYGSMNGEENTIIEESLPGEEIIFYGEANGLNIIDVKYIWQTNGTEYSLEEDCMYGVYENGVNYSVCRSTVDFYRFEEALKYLAELRKLLFQQERERKVIVEKLCQCK